MGNGASSNGAIQGGGQLGGLTDDGNIGLSAKSAMRKKVSSIPFHVATKASIVIQKNMRMWLTQKRLRALQDSNLILVDEEPTLRHSGKTDTNPFRVQSEKTGGPPGSLSTKVLANNRFLRRAEDGGETADSLNAVDLNPQLKPDILDKYAPFPLIPSEVIIYPQVGFVVKTKVVDTGRKFFLNVCHHEVVPTMAHTATRLGDVMTQGAPGFSGEGVGGMMSPSGGDIGGAGVSGTWGTGVQGEALTSSSSKPPLIVDVVIPTKEYLQCFRFDSDKDDMVPISEAVKVEIATQSLKFWNSQEGNYEISLQFSLPKMKRGYFGELAPLLFSTVSKGVSYLPDPRIANTDRKESSFRLNVAPELKGWYEMAAVCLATPPTSTFEDILHMKLSSRVDVSQMLMSSKREFQQSMKQKQKVVEVYFPKPFERQLPLYGPAYATALASKEHIIGGDEYGYAAADMKKGKKQKKRKRKKEQQGTDDYAPSMKTSIGPPAEANSLTIAEEEENEPASSRSSLPPLSPQAPVGPKPSQRGGGRGGRSRQIRDPRISRSAPTSFALQEEGPDEEEEEEEGALRSPSLTSRHKNQSSSSLISGLFGGRKGGGADSPLPSTAGTAESGRGISPSGRSGRSQQHKKNAPLGTPSSRASGSGGGGRGRGGRGGAGYPNDTSEYDQSGDGNGDSGEDYDDDEEEEEDDDEEEDGFGYDDEEEDIEEADNRAPQQGFSRKRAKTSESSKIRSALQPSKPPTPSATMPVFVHIQNGLIFFYNRDPARVTYSPHFQSKQQQLERQKIGLQPLKLLARILLTDMVISCSQASAIDYKRNTCNFFYLHFHPVPLTSGVSDKDASSSNSPNALVSELLAAQSGKFNKLLPRPTVSLQFTTFAEVLTWRAYLKEHISMANAVRQRIASYSLSTVVNKQFLGNYPRSVTLSLTQHVSGAITAGVFPPALTGTDKRHHRRLRHRTRRVILRVSMGTMTLYECHSSTVSSKTTVEQYSESSPPSSTAATTEGSVENGTQQQLEQQQDAKNKVVLRVDKKGALIKSVLLSNKQVECFTKRKIHIANLTNAATIVDTDLIRLRLTDEEFEFPECYEFLCDPTTDRVLKQKASQALEFDDSDDSDGGSSDSDEDYSADEIAERRNRRRIHRQKEAEASKAHGSDLVAILRENIAWAQSRSPMYHLPLLEAEHAVNADGNASKFARVGVTISSAPDIDSDDDDDDEAEEALKHFTLQSVLYVNRPEAHFKGSSSSLTGGKSKRRKGRSSSRKQQEKESSIFSLDSDSDDDLSLAGMTAATVGHGSASRRSGTGTGNADDGMSGVPVDGIPPRERKLLVSAALREHHNNNVAIDTILSTIQRFHHFPGSNVSITDDHHPQLNYTAILHGDKLYIYHSMRCMLVLDVSNCCDKRTFFSARKDAQAGIRRPPLLAQQQQQPASNPESIFFIDSDDEEDAALLRSLGHSVPQASTSEKAASSPSPNQESQSKKNSVLTLPPSKAPANFPVREWVIKLVCYDNRSYLLRFFSEEEYQDWRRAIYCGGIDLAAEHPTEPLKNNNEELERKLEREMRRKERAKEKEKKKLKAAAANGSGGKRGASKSRARDDGGGGGNSGEEAVGGSGGGSGSGLSSLMSSMGIGGGANGLREEVESTRRYLRLLRKDEKVFATGMVLKTEKGAQGQQLKQKRILVLTDAPRLLFIDQIGNIIRGHLELAKYQQPDVKMLSIVDFEVNVGGTAVQLSSNEMPEKNAMFWMTKINGVCGLK